VHSLVYISQQRARREEGGGAVVEEEEDASAAETAATATRSAAAAPSHPSAALPWTPPPAAAGDRNSGSGNNATEQQIHLTPREVGKNSEVRHTRDGSRVKVGVPSSVSPEGRAECFYVDRRREARQYATSNWRR
jgi:hypothetical protein